MELEDQTWFPAFLRNMQTQFIGWMVGITGFYKPLAGELASLAREKNGRVHDLCSGCGEPWLSLSKTPQLADIHVVLSDKFPQTLKINNIHCQYLPQSVDAVNGPFPENHLVTFFNAFHHFDAPTQKQIIAQLLARNNSVCIAEILEPNAITYLKIFITTTLLQFLMAPFVAPFSLKRLFFTWILPVNLFTVTFDGLVSVYRCRYLKNTQWQNILPEGGKAKYNTIKTLLGPIHYVVIK